MNNILLLNNDKLNSLLMAKDFNSFLNVKFSLYQHMLFKYTGTIITSMLLHLSLELTEYSIYLLIGLHVILIKFIFDDKLHKKMDYYIKRNIAIISVYWIIPAIFYIIN